jgi:predicted phosphodiesterase
MRVLVTVLAVLAAASFAAGQYRDLQAVIQVEHISIAFNPVPYGQGTLSLPVDDPRLARNVTGLDPEQVHLTYNSPTSVTVSWATGEAYVGTGTLSSSNVLQAGSEVFYGTKSGAYSGVATGTSSFYTQVYTYSPSAAGGNPNLNYTSPQLHNVVLSGLTPNTQYFYVVGDPTLGNSTEFSFFTQPKGPTYPYTVGVFADVGQTINSSDTINHMIASDPDIVVLLGDFTYADDHLTNGTVTVALPNFTYPYASPSGTYQPRWDMWYRLAQPLLSTKALVGCVGNHEIEPQGGGIPYTGFTQFASWQARNPVPHNASGSTQPFWYSVNSGPAHIIMLSNYHDFSVGSVQYDWLIEDLVAVDRTVTPWIIAGWHAPWYSSYTKHYKETECMRQAMEDVLYEAGVDVVLNGHLHEYERSNSLYNYTLDPCGTVHITMGDGGNVEGLYTSFIDQPGGCPAPNTLPNYQPGGYCPNFPYDGKYCSSSQPQWSAVRQPAFGHATLTVENATHALWQWNRNFDPISYDFDTIYIIRDLTCPNKVNPLGSTAAVSTASVGK